MSDFLVLSGDGSGFSATEGLTPDRALRGVKAAVGDFVTKRSYRDDIGNEIRIVLFFEK